MKEKFIDLIARELAIHLFMSCSSDVRQERTLLEHETARFLRREYGFLDKAGGWIPVTERLPETKEVDGVYIIPKGRCYISKHVLVKKDYEGVVDDFRYEMTRYRRYDDGEPDWSGVGAVVAWMEIPE